MRKVVTLDGLNDFASKAAGKSGNKSYARKTGVLSNIVDLKLYSHLSYDEKESLELKFQIKQLTPNSLNGDMCFELNVNQIEALKNTKQRVYFCPIFGMFAKISKCKSTAFRAYKTIVNKRGLTVFDWEEDSWTHYEVTTRLEYHYEPIKY